VDARFLGSQDAALKFVVAEFKFSPNHLAAQFVGDAPGEIELRLRNWQNADLFGREPEREVAGVMSGSKSPGTST